MEFKEIIADNIKLEEMADKIDELEKILQAEEIKIDSDAGKNFIEKVDTQLREAMNIDSAPDTGGINRMAKELESKSIQLIPIKIKIKITIIIIKIPNHQNHLKKISILL